MPKKRKNKSITREQHMQNLLKSSAAKKKKPTVSQKWAKATKNKFDLTSKKYNAST